MLPGLEQQSGVCIDEWRWTSHALFSCGSSHLTSTLSAHSALGCGWPLWSPLIGGNTRQSAGDSATSAASRTCLVLAVCSSSCCRPRFGGVSWTSVSPQLKGLTWHLIAGLWTRDCVAMMVVIMMVIVMVTTLLGSVKVLPSDCRYQVPRVRSTGTCTWFGVRMLRICRAPLLHGVGISRPSISSLQSASVNGFKLTCLCSPGPCLEITGARSADAQDALKDGVFFHWTSASCVLHAA